MQQWEKDINKGLEDVIKTLGYILKNFFVGVFYGTKKLKQRKLLIGFCISMLIPIVWIVTKENFLKIENTVWRYLIYYVGLISPLLYLKSISAIGIDKELGKKLIQAGIVCQDGKPPFLLSNEQNKKGYEVLRFKGSYKIDSWKKKIGDIETALNITIIDIEQGSRKDIVDITTVPAKCKMPKSLNWNDKYLLSEDGLVSLGNNGVEDITLDFNKDPHIIVAGATGSGKSVMLRAILWQFIKQGHKPIMADFKNGLEFGKQYRQFGETVTDKERLLEVLETLRKENDLRQLLFERSDVKNIKEYNKKHKNKICRVIVVIDEVAEILDKVGLEGEEKELILKIEKNISSFARVSRASGIHFMLGIQRPDAKVLTGQIKTNCTGRICGRVSDGAASEIVLNNTLAAGLPKVPGRMLFQNGADTIEFQGYYFDDDIDLKDIDVEMGILLTEDRNFNIDTLEFKRINKDKLDSNNTHNPNSDLLDLDTLDIKNDEDMNNIIEFENGIIVEQKLKNIKSDKKIDIDEKEYRDWNYNKK